jgi:hypothetical protein
VIPDDYTIEVERLRLTTQMMEAQIAVLNAKTETTRVMGAGGTAEQVTEARELQVTAQARLADAQAAYESFNQDHPPQ